MSCPILAVKYSKNSQQQPPETARNTLIMAGQPAKHLSAPELWGRRQQTGGEEKGERWEQRAQCRLSNLNLCRKRPINRAYLMSELHTQTCRGTAVQTAATLSLHVFIHICRLSYSRTKSEIWTSWVASCWGEAPYVCGKKKNSYFEKQKITDKQLTDRILHHCHKYGCTVKMLWLYWVGLLIGNTFVRLGWTADFMMMFQANAAVRPSASVLRWHLEGWRDAHATQETRRWE